jgi:hypothetical protein
MAQSIQSASFAVWEWDKIFRLGNFFFLSKDACQRVDCSGELHDFEECGSAVPLLLLFFELPFELFLEPPFELVFELLDLVEAARGGNGDANWPD